MGPFVKHDLRMSCHFVCRPYEQQPDLLKTTLGYGDESLRGQFSQVRAGKPQCAWFQERAARSRAKSNAARRKAGKLVIFPCALGID